VGMLLAVAITAVGHVSARSRLGPASARCWRRAWP
jgi:hypothetical protein